MKDNNTEILNLLSIVLGICALFLLVLSTLFNIYSYNISSDEELIITNRNLLVNYKSGKTVTLKNIEPGISLAYEFELSSKEDATGIFDYELYFDVIENTFNGSMLFYKYECSSSLNYDSGKLVNNSDWISFSEGQMASYSGTIKPGEVQSCSFKIFYSHLTSTKKNSLTGEILIKESQNSSITD